MPVKARIPKERRPHFSNQALDLFIELERMPQSDPRFKQKSRQLAALLGLLDEWICSSTHVNDRSRAPAYPSGPAHDDWVHVRAVRELLIQEVKEQPPPRLT